MSRLFWLSVILLLAGFYFSGCKQAAAPSPRGEKGTPGEKIAMLSTKADWEQRWDSVLAEARKEGKVSVYTIWRPETRVALGKAFKERYGITPEFTVFGRGPELLARVKAEMRAGLYLADVFGAGNTSLIVSMKPDGLLGSTKPLLLLPEVLDPKAWRAGKIPFTDEEGHALSIVGGVEKMVVYNTDLVKEGEITSVRDILRPQYRGRIIIFDPTVTGPGNASISHIGINLWGEDKTVEFLRQLVRDQKAVIQRDGRIHIESVAQGKFAVGFAPLPDLIKELMVIGAPLKAAVVEEDNRLSAAAGAIGVPTQLAHPDATRVFVNWLMNKEGQSVFGTTFGKPGQRIDASTEGIDPIFIPALGKKYYLEWEYVEQLGKWLTLSKKVIDEATR